ncbi:hypothetical protein JCM6882_000222 [Rhodosporidiobolus microsporus]
MPRFTPYYDPTAPPARPKRWTSSAPLQSTSKHNAPSPAEGGKDSKGKGKARVSDGLRSRMRQQKAWKGVDALLAQSFTLHRLSALSSPPFSASCTSSDFKRFSSSLRAFLQQQLALGLDADETVKAKDGLVERVEAGFVDLPLFGKSGEKVRPVLLEVERSVDADAAEASSSSGSFSRVSTFVFLPSSTSSPDHPYPLLLTKSPSPALTTLVHRLLTTRHDASLLPHRIPPPAMLDLLETVVQNRDTDYDEVDVEAGEAGKGLSTTATFAFPKEVAKDGLNTLTLTLPPAILPFLCRAPAASAATSSSSPAPPSSFTSALSLHLHTLTSLSLSSLFLVRFGAGRGTFVHSGQGAGDAGARVKFFRGAEEGEEVKRVLEGLVRAAEQGRGA